MAVAAVALVWAALWAPQLFRGQVFVAGDATAFRAFGETSRARWFAEHRRTFFSPYVFGGIPATGSLADPRPQWLPDALLDLWEVPGRNPAWPPLLPELLVQLASMLAAGALARGLWGGGPATFAGAALAWGLASYACLPIAFGHDAQFVSLAWMPIALYAMHMVFTARSGRGALGAALFLATASALLVLAGHPQYTIYLVPLLAVVVLERLFSTRRPRRAVLALAALLLGAALSAALWWPAYLYRELSVRGAMWGGVGLDEVHRWSLDLRDVGSFAWPDAAGFGGASYRGGLAFAEYPPYLGLAAIALALIGWPHRRGVGRAAWALWAFVALSACVLAFGVHLGAAYEWIYDHVPLWSSLRVAVGTVALAQLALALLAARGIARLEAGRGGATAAVLATLVVAVLALDFARVDVPVLARSAGPAAAFAPAPPSVLAQVAARDPHARALPLDKPAFLSNDSAWWGMRSLGGLHGSAPHWWNELRERNLLGRYAVMCAFGVRWVASDTLALDDPDLFAPEPGAPGVHRVLHALPRAYGVPRVEAPGNDEAVYAALSADDFRPDRVAYASDAGARGDYPGGASLAVRWVTDAADEIELESSAPGDAFLVLADAWFPGWRASVDGAGVTIHRVNAMLRGIAVPAGTHRVRFVYEPDGWAAAIPVARGAWAFAALAAFALITWPRSRPRTTS